MLKKYRLGLLAAGALLAAGTLTTVPAAQARDRISFSINLGDVALGYQDGYYDRDRRWHRWNNNAERDWYRQRRRDAYFAMRRDNDRDRYRRDWWNGRRDDWRFRGGNNGADFAIVLGNIVFAYNDGYYDHDRRWHAWRSNDEREWYRRHYGRTYYNYRHDNDRDHRRRDWREGRRNNWQF